MEREAAGLFKKGKLIQAKTIMEDLIGYSLEMGGFEQLSSREAMMAHIEGLLQCGTAAARASLGTE